MQKTIHIIGRGLSPELHLNLAGLRALKNADLVIGIEFDSAAWEQIGKEFAIPMIHHIPQHYSSELRDIENYQNFVMIILNALEQHNTIAVLVAGHPRLGVSFVSLLEQAVGGRDVRVELVPNVSSFDILLNDLRLDALEQGSVVLDCNRLLLFSYQLDPSLNYFLYHSSSIGNRRTQYDQPSQGNRIDLLQEYLLKFFDPNKVITLCKAYCDANAGAYIQVSLGDLCAARDVIDYATTIFIPAEKPKSMNKDFLQILRGVSV